MKWYINLSAIVKMVLDVSLFNNLIHRIQVFSLTTIAMF